jgi:hypothetical protein
MSATAATQPYVRRSFASIVSILLLATASPSHAGQLDEFEKAATEERKEDHNPPHHDDTDYYDDDDDSYFSIFFETAGAFVAEGWKASAARMAPPNSGPYADTPQREPGEPLLPYLRIDAGWQHIDDNIQAVDTRIEAGYGPLALAYRHTHYMERDTDDTLNLAYAHALYRFSPTPAFEVDLALGATVLDGNNTHAGFSVGIPITWYPWKNVGLRFAPTWSSINSNWISDYDTAVQVSIRFMTIFAGYRYVDAGGETLDGPYCGVSFHY